MRVLLLADTHGVVDARIVALAAECDLVVHAGDIGSAIVLDHLRARCTQVVAVRGNNDKAVKWPQEQAAVLAALPAQVELELPGGVLSVVHGDVFAAAGRHARLRATFAHSRAVAFGHSHRLVIDDAALPWILNPGAAGRTRTRGGPSCLLLAVSRAEWSATPVRFPQAA